MAENNNEKKIELEENEIMRVILKKVADGGEQYHCELNVCVSNKVEDAQMIRKALVKLCQHMGVVPGLAIYFPRHIDSEEKKD